MQTIHNLSRGKKVLATLLGVVVVMFGVLLVLRIAYFGRIYPGVTANGVYLGGLKAEEAARELEAQTSAYTTKPIEVIAPQEKQSLSAAQLGVAYDNQAALSQAMEVGRDGWVVSRLASQLMSLLGQSPTITQVDYDSAQLSSTLTSLNTTVAKPVENARFVPSDGDIAIQDSAKGKRVDYALAPSAITNHFGNLQNKLFVLPTLTVDPQLTSQALSSQKSIIAPFAKQPLLLTYGGKKWTADMNTVVSWLTLPSSNQPVLTRQLANYYTLTHVENNGQVFYDKKAVHDYITSLSSDINVTPVDAQLTISGEKATVFTQSRDGKTLNVEATTDAVMQQLTAATPAPVTLTVVVTKAEVSDDNIDALGIKELISEGVSYFPGSSANRMQNVRVGASKFNNILIKPGEVFSFNKYLGEVSAATGYAEGIVILADREETQYGGGLCQVSSTAYRAALLAGLPILSRVNHAFAVDYYTQPFGVPGVDATIYLPNPDMQFRNDTGKHILMQTIMSGTTLRFRFFGTKTKTGVIRGPFFVTGSLDHTQPSQTVFYRDVLDLAGNVVKTDTTTTFYKSSSDYPLVN